MTSDGVFALVLAALGPIQEGAPAPTAAGDRVYHPGVLPTQQDAYPQLKARLITESRDSLGRGDVQFTTIATIRIVGEVSAPALISDVQKSDVEAQLWALKRQVDRAIINSYPLFSQVQQLASVQSQLSYDAQATMLAGVQSDYAFEFYEGSEDFAPIAATDLDQVVGTLDDDTDTGFSAHLQP